jgi:hypothetical protein
MEPARQLPEPRPRLRETGADSFGIPLPHGMSRSALVVSHHLGGLLRTDLRGFVAPRYRSWGSTRFTIVAARRPKAPPDSDAIPAPLQPLEEFPSSAAAPRHRGRCPPGVTARTVRLVLTRLRARRRFPVCPLHAPPGDVIRRSHRRWSHGSSPGREALDRRSEPPRRDRGFRSGPCHRSGADPHEAPFLRAGSEEPRPTTGVAGRSRMGAMVSLGRTRGDSRRARRSASVASPLPGSRLRLAPRRAATFKALLRRRVRSESPLLPETVALSFHGL